MTRFTHVSFTASAALLLALVVTGHAQANDCTSSSDCDKGFQCQDVGGVDCTAPACAPGESCPEPEPCATRAQMECVPAQCTSDAQCGDGMVCHAYTQSCPTVDCACSSDQPDCQCDIAPCDPQTLSYCTPRYALPCTVAADCGTGFSCQELESCGCSGSSGSGAEPAPAEAKPLPPDADSDAAPPAGDPLPPECSCEPSGQSACVPQEIECGSDAACPAGWTCQQDPNTGTSSGCAGDGCGAAPAPEPLPTRTLCFPKYYGGVGVGIGEDLGGTPTSGGDDEGTANPEAAGKASDADSSESAACQMGHAPASRSAFGIAALLGALFGLSRRRAQRSA